MVVVASATLLRCSSEEMRGATTGDESVAGTVGGASAIGDEDTVMGRMAD